MIENNGLDRQAIDAHPLVDLGRPLLRRMAGIEMPHSAKPRLRMVTKLGMFDEGDFSSDGQSADLRFTAAERPRSVAIS